MQERHEVGGVRCRGVADDAQLAAQGARLHVAPVTAADAPRCTDA